MTTTTRLTRAEVLDRLLEVGVYSAESTTARDGFAGLQVSLSSRRGKVRDSFFFYRPGSLEKLESQVRAAGFQVEASQRVDKRWPKTSFVEVEFSW